MGLFSKLFNRNDPTGDAINEASLELFAPSSGHLMSLNEVPDLVISEKIIGDGVAVIPNDLDNITAPCDGVISRFISSKNAFSIRADKNIEIYVSFGIGVNTFTGEGLQAMVKVGDVVKTGDVVINVTDRHKVKSSLENTAVSMIVVNSSAPIARVINKNTGSAE
ncbi:MAG: PTS glucose transporter subunit IIA, partial [Succinivibrio sp.]